MVETVKGADFVLLVTEPTPFGLNDLKLAVEMLRIMSLHFAVVVNRSREGATAIHAYCAGEGIDIIAEIPDDRRIAESYSRGELIVEAVPGMDAMFSDIYERLLQAAALAQAFWSCGESRLRAWVRCSQNRGYFQANTGCSRSATRVSRPANTSRN